MPLDDRRVFLAMVCIIYPCFWEGRNDGSSGERSTSVDYEYIDSLHCAIKNCLCSQQNYSCLILLLYRLNNAYLHKAEFYNNLLLSRIYDLLNYSTERRGAWSRLDKRWSFQLILVDFCFRCIQGSKGEFQVERG